MRVLFNIRTEQFCCCADRPFWLDPSSLVSFQCLFSTEWFLYSRFDIRSRWQLPWLMFNDVYYVKNDLLFRSQSWACKMTDHCKYTTPGVRLPTGACIYRLSANFIPSLGHINLQSSRYRRLFPLGKEPRYETDLECTPRCTYAFTCWEVVHIPREGLRFPYHWVDSHYCWSPLTDGDSQRQGPYCKVLPRRLPMRKETESTNDSWEQSPSS